MAYAGIERRSRKKTGAVTTVVVAVSALAAGPVFLMAQSSFDRVLVFLSCLPLSGLSYAWLWRERRLSILRWANLAFAGAVCAWVAFFFSFIFERRDETQGMVLVTSSIVINLLLFWFLNLTWNRRRAKPAELPPVAVL